MSDNSRAVGAAAVTVVLWASAFVSIRSAGAYLAPGALALGRLAVASLALGAVWLISDRRWPPRAAWPGILGSGLLWFGLYMVLLNWGEREVDAGTASMLVNIGPVLIALLGGWLLREGFPRRLAAGMAVSFGGGWVISQEIQVPGIRRQPVEGERGAPADSPPAIPDNGQHAEGHAPCWCRSGHATGIARSRLLPPLPGEGHNLRFR